MEKTLESPLDSKAIKSVNPKWSQPWTFIGGTDAETEAPILWPPDVMSWLMGKDPDAGKDWKQKEKGETEEEMVRQHHQLNGHEFEQTTEDKEGQGNLMCFQFMGLQNQTQLSNWTTVTTIKLWNHHYDYDRVFASLLKVSLYTLWSIHRCKFSVILCDFIFA